MDVASSVDANGRLDIYGVVIPDEMCEDALLDFGNHVNAFMESKFEVRITFKRLCYVINFSDRANKTARNGLRTRPRLIQRSLTVPDRRLLVC